MPSGSRSSGSWPASSGDGYTDDLWWNNNLRHRPQLFSHLWQGQYRINPQQNNWGNRNIMRWIPQPPDDGWSPIYPPDYRGWR
ncbi:hypothetical protein diail_2476 [Diaporthe ilicicola]|nr:hypothetical protein diail_2476 [Diaporthe ilicicola]